MQGRSCCKSKGHQQNCKLECILPSQTTSCILHTLFAYDCKEKLAITSDSVHCASAAATSVGFPFRGTRTKVVFTFGLQRDISSSTMQLHKVNIGFFSSSSSWTRLYRQLPSYLSIRCINLKARNTCEKSMTSRLQENHGRETRQTRC